jgi:dihydroorotase
VFDAAASWAVTPDRLASQGKHTPFEFSRSGFELPARVRCTLVGGQVAFERE